VYRKQQQQQQRVVGSTHPKLSARRAPGEGMSRSTEGMGITWRPGDILRTSHAKDVGLEADKKGRRPEL